MNEIAYLDYFKESYPTGRKPAKISQEKIRNLKRNYHNNLKTVVKLVNTSVNDTVNSNVVPFPGVQAAVNEAPSVVAPITPVVPVVSQPVVKNYNNVANNFNMTVYEKSFNETTLTGARKIRVSQKTKDEVNGYSAEMGHGKLENIIPFPTVATNTVEPIAVSSNIGSNVLEFPRTNTSVINNTISSPSVDDYLQKDKPSTENGIILQLAGDVESLKEQTVKQSAILEQLEAKYNELKAKREQRIKELEEEKLSYTATLEGLTERIRNLQEAIQQEEQGLGRRAA